MDEKYDIKDAIDDIDDDDTFTGERLKEMLHAMYDYMESQVKVAQLTKELYKKLNYKK